MLARKVLFGLVLLSGSALFAQDAESHLPITLGLKGGVPVTDMFSASNTSLFGNNQQIPGSNYSSHTPRYIMGVSGEFHLVRGLRLEVDGLYKRGGFTGVNAFGSGLARPLPAVRGYRCIAPAHLDDYADNKRSWLCFRHYRPDRA